MKYVCETATHAYSEIQLLQRADKSFANFSENGGT